MREEGSANLPEAQKRTAEETVMRGQAGWSARTDGQDKSAPRHAQAPLLRTVRSSPGSCDYRKVREQARSTGLWALPAALGQ